MKEKINKKWGILLNIVYISIWFIPLSIFVWDFFDLNQIKEVVEYRTFTIFYNSIKQALLSMIISFFIAILPSIYYSKNNNWLASFLGYSIFIPFFFPPISVIVVFSIILFSNDFIRSLNIQYSLRAIIIAHVFYNSPIFVKYIGGALRKISTELEEAAELESKDRFKIFYHIHLPLVMPSILKAAFLVFAFCFTSFAVVMSLGTLRYSTFEVAIVESLLVEFNFTKAFGYAFIQFCFLVILNWFIIHCEDYELHTESIRRGKGSLLFLIGSLIYIFFEYSIVTIGIVSSFFNFHNFSLDFSGLVNIFSVTFNNKFPVMESILNSIYVSLFTSFCVTIFTYLLLKNRSKLSEIIIISSIGISSAFISLCLIYQNIMFDVPLVFLLFIGLFFINIPISYSFMYQHIVGFSKDIIEAAKIDGASSLNRFFYIEMPILLPILISSMLQNFAIIYGEFTIAYTMQMDKLFPISSVVNYTLSSRRLFLESSAMSALNLIIIMTMFFISQLFVKKFNKLLVD